MNMTIRNKRSDLDEVICMIPNSEQCRGNGLAEFGKKYGTPTMKDGVVMSWTLTTRQEARGKDAEGQIYYKRWDLLLTSLCTRCGNAQCCSARQWSISPAVEGMLAGDFDKFSEEDIAWAREESKKIWELAKTEPWIAKSLGWGPVTA